MRNRGRSRSGVTTDDRTITHYPTPAVSPGSPVLIVIEDLLREAYAGGHADKVLIQPWRGERFHPDWIVPSAEPTDLMGNRLLALGDHALARVLGIRPTTELLYRSSLRGVDLSGVTDLVLHDGSFAFAGARLLGTKKRNYHLSYYSHIALSRSLGRRELGAMLDRLDHCIQVSDFMADRLRERLGRDHPALVTVHNGVDTSLFSPRAEGLNLERRIAWVGKIGANKGPDKVLDALQRCSVTDWAMTFVGSSWYAPGDVLSDFERQLRQTAAALPGTTEFVGYKARPEIPDILRNQRVFVFPTMLDEAFGLVLLEAMACGVACIASPRGGVPEFARDAVVFVDPNNAEEFGGALEWLLTDDQAARDLGEKARRRALDFTTARQYERLREVLFAE